MAGRLITEKLQWEKMVGHGGVRTEATGAALLGSGERNVRLVQVTARPFITAAEAQEGGAAVRGTVEFAALYQAEDGTLGSCRAQAGFTAEVPVEGAEAGQYAEAMATTEEVSAKEHGGRLEFAAQLMLQAAVTDRKGVEAAVGVEAQSEMAELHRHVQGLCTAQTGSVREALAEAHPVEAEGMTQVAWFTAKPQVENVMVMDGVAEITGQVVFDCLLTGEEGREAETQRAGVPFAVEVTGEGFRSGMQVRADVQVSQADAHILLPAEEGMEAVLQTECVLEALVKGLSVTEGDVLSDAYPLDDEPFVAATAVVEGLREQEDVETVQTVEATLELPQDVPAIRRVVGAYASPLALDVVEDEEVRAEGLLRVTLLYVADDAEGGLAVYEQEVPFGVSFAGIPAGAQLWRVEIEDVQAQRISPTQAQVRVEIEMEAVHSRQEAAEVVEAISFEGERAVVPAGITLYYPEAQETMWDVAKRYRVREEALKARNPEGKVPLMIYRRLTEF